jgi:histidine ammonia-lyase
MAAVDVVRLTTAGLVAEHVGRLAHGARLELAPEVAQLVHASRSVVERRLQDGELVYGLDTGVGSRRDRPVSREDLDR